MSGRISDRDGRKATVADRRTLSQPAAHMTGMATKTKSQSQSQSNHERIFADATEAFREMTPRIRAAAARARGEHSHLDAGNVEGDVAMAIFEMELAGKIITARAVEVLIKDAVFTARGEVGGPSRSTRSRATAATGVARDELGREPSAQEVAARGGVSVDAVRTVHASTASLEDAEHALSVASAEDRLLAEMEREDHRALIYDVASVHADIQRLVEARTRDNTDGGVDTESQELLLELLMMQTSTRDLRNVASEASRVRFQTRKYTAEDLAELLGVSTHAVERRVTELRRTVRDAHRECCGS